MLLVRDLERTDLKVLLGLGVGEALVNEGQDSDDDEDNASEFHRDVLLVGANGTIRFGLMDPWQAECQIRDFIGYRFLSMDYVKRTSERIPFKLLQ
jgi:hypothetical protein